MKSFKFPIFIKFTNPLKSTIYPQIYQKITKMFTKPPKTYICGMSREIFNCLKRQRDIFA